MNDDVRMNDGWYPLILRWMMDDVRWFSPGEMDDIQCNRNEWWMISGEALWDLLLLLLLLCSCCCCSRRSAAAPLLSAALSRCHSVLLQCHQQLDEQKEPAKPSSQPASQQEEEKKRQSVIERFGLVRFGFVLPSPISLSGILLPTGRRTAPGTFLFHVPLLLFLFYCCWLQCYSTVVGLVRELFFFSFLLRTL